LTGKKYYGRLPLGIKKNLWSGMFRRGNCHVKIIKTFAQKAEVFCLYNKEEKDEFYT